MRASTRVILGAGASLSLLLGRLSVPAPVAADHKPRPPSCTFTLEHRTDSDRALVGDDVRVEVVADPVCFYQPPVAHWVVVADDSRGLSRDQVASARDVTRDVRERLFSEPPYPRMGAVGHGGYSGCELQDTANLAARCLDQVLDEPRGGTPIGSAAGALKEAVPKLRRAHLQHPYDWETRQVVVLLAAPPERRACNELLRSAAEVKRYGALLVTVCLSGNCGNDCLERAATSWRYAYDLDSVGGFMRSVIDRIREDIISVKARRIDLTYPIEPDTGFVTGSLAWDTQGRDGAQGSFDETERVVRWSTTWVPPDGVTVTFGVRFDTPGAHVLGERAVFTGIDSFRVPFSAALESHTVWANGLRPY